MASGTRALIGAAAIGVRGLQAEMCDWHRSGRAGKLMGSVGLVPAETSSSGAIQRGAVLAPA